MYMRMVVFSIEFCTGFSVFSLANDSSHREPRCHSSVFFDVFDVKFIHVLVRIVVSFFALTIDRDSLAMQVCCVGDNLKEGETTITTYKES